CSLLICVGGDGTLEAAAVAALGRSVPLLPVPCGGDSLFARALGQPGRVDRVVDLLEHGDVVHVDVGVRNGKLFLCQESYGFLQIRNRAEANAGSPRAGWRHRLAYYGRAARHLLDTPLVPLQVSVDGRVVARDAVIVTVANAAPYAAGSAAFGPAAGRSPERPAGGSRRGGRGALRRAAPRRDDPGGRAHAHALRRVEGRDRRAHGGGHRRPQRRIGLAQDGADRAHAFGQEADGLIDGATAAHRERRAQLVEDDPVVARAREDPPYALGVGERERPGRVGRRRRWKRQMLRGGLERQEEPRALCQLLP